MTGRRARVGAELLVAATPNRADPLEAVEVRRVQLPLLRPHRSANSVETVRELLVVRVLGADGAEGWAEGPTLGAPGYVAETTQIAWDRLRTDLAPRLVAGDLAAVDASSSVSEASMAGAALADALLDRSLRREGRSLASDLGVEGVAVDWCGVLGMTDEAEDPGELEAAALGALGDGCVAVKAKVRPGWSEVPVRRLATLVRQRPGATGAHDPVDVHADANGSFDPGAPELAALDALGLGYLEQPCAPGVEPPRLTSAVVLDEGLSGAAALRRWVTGGGKRYANLKPARFGGVAAAVSLIDDLGPLASRLFVGGMVESSLGRAAAVAVAAYLRACAPSSLPTDLGPSGRYVPGPVDLADGVGTDGSGALVVPPGPGLGAEPRRDALAAATVDMARIGPTR